jgi:ADP-heptose:LPS heptosyltransferase
VTGYFVGELEYDYPPETLIGLHAGSKAGSWLSKRWPYFAELAARLQRRGFRVASFGTEDEYVEGTENQTGGSIEEMCRRMLACTHFVSNDSGLMNIANAIGIPVLAIFGPTNVDTRLPLKATTTAISLQKSCAPCEVKDPRYFSEGRCSCIAELSVERVEAAVLGHMTSVDALFHRPGLQQFA